MSQIGDYEDLISSLEKILKDRNGTGKGLSIDADHILYSFGSMKCMDFVFDMFDDEEWVKDYPLMSEYMKELN